MSTTARSTSTSVAALLLALGALTARAEDAPRPAPKPVVRVVGLVPAADAILIDCTEMTIDQVFAEVMRLVVERGLAEGR